jgi:uncharacterized membrane protein HdeD (DUF308 family)
MASVRHENTDPARLIARLRKGLMVAGAVMMALGIAALILPAITSFVVEVLIGWLLLVSGAVAVIGAMSVRGTSLFIWELVPGAITFCVGLLLLLFPFQGLVALTALIAVVFLLTGVAQMSFAFWARPTPGWIWVSLSALFSIMLGVFILFALPEASAVFIGLLVGIDLLSTGAALVMIARLVPRDVAV